MKPFKQYINENTEPLHTLRGSIIRRYQNNVGKIVGHDVYFHKNYAKEIIPAQLLNNAIKSLVSSFTYNTMVFNKKTNSIRFDTALNFDTAREPWAGDYISITSEGKLRYGKTDYIWHHKWLWVKDDYSGFDIQESYNWSKLWLSKLTQPASGIMQIWKQQLANIGLI